MSYIGQEIHHWFGVRLDRERTDLDMDDLAYLMNGDLFLEVGTIQIRRGRSYLTTSQLSNTVVRGLSRVNSKRYQIASTVAYRELSPIITGLHSNLVTTIQAARPLNDTSTWAFIADGSTMQKDDGTYTRNWSIAAPTVAATVGTTGTGLTGTYSVKYTYIRKVGSNVIAESNPSPVSANQTLANQNLAISAITNSTDAQVTHIRIYRTVNGGGVWLYDQEINNSTTTATSSNADSALGSEVETDNAVAPNAGFVSAEHEGRLWLCQDPSYPHYLYYTKRFKPEFVPAANYLEISTPENPLQCAHPYGGLLIVLAKTQKYRVVGSGDVPFVAQPIPSKRGTPSWNAADGGEDGVYYLALDGVFKTNGFGADEQLAGPILPLFERRSVNGYSAINFDAASTFSLRIWKRRLYLSVADGTSTTPNRIWVNKIGTEKWQAYDHAMAALHYEADTDFFVAGGHDGFVHRLETGADDASGSITMTAETKDYAHVTEDSPGGPLARKIYHAVKEDVEGGPITTTFYVDGTSMLQTSVATTRQPSPIRLPPKAQGYRWRKRWSYTGTGTPKIYATTTYALPLAGA